MEHKFLNVSILQTVLAKDLETNIQTIENAVNSLMLGYVKPELVVGVEFGIVKAIPITIDHEAMKRLGDLAKKHHIYLVPGTFAEKSDQLPEGEYYNTCPVFAPDGSMLAVYRKKVPFRPGELSTPSGTDDYCIFEIVEKNIKVGINICYEQFFPEIPRTLALMGAELILCPALDPMEYKHIPEIIPRCRALENELFYIWTCGTGQFGPTTACGNSIIADPEGSVVFQCGSGPELVTKTLDMSMVNIKRNYGRDQHLKSLRHYEVNYPFAENIAGAPVYETMDGLTLDKTEYKKKVSEILQGSI